MKALKSTSAYGAIRSIVFEQIPNATSLQNISNVKKLKGSDNAYRLRVGDYRIGFTFANDTITFARVHHRSDVYRYFP
ncbi:type II toxin-antitoxin system RelE/ParE family toxin [Microcoleus sp. FACHB-1515]|uniref:type II toxin-antitoxin system RelE family toxin n=1 Tax=Microcoleus sp. FACHB-1515 TaxID=2692821 RepID=UPI0018EF42D2|nr:type II toxin-antitoxin system RelE/ParE family toxin [Microcoleus sp. FACHB-1515]